MLERVDVSVMLLLVFLAISSWEDLRSQSVGLRWLVCWVAGGSGWMILEYSRGSLTLLDGLIALAPGLLLTGIGIAARGGVGAGDGLVWLVIGALCSAEDCWAAFALSLAFVFLWSAGLLIMKRAGRKTRIPFVPFSLAGVLLWMAGSVIGI